MELEHKLRAAVRPQDPGPDFTASVLARVQSLPAASRPSATHRMLSWRAPLAMAATIAVLAVGVNWHLGQLRAERAAAQLTLALQITSNELNQLQRRLAPTP